MEVRHLTIAEASSPKGGGKVPFLKLFGKWLEEKGFRVNKSVRLEIAPERIVITPAPEIDRLREQKTEKIYSLFKELQELNNDSFELDGNGTEAKQSNQRRKSPQKVMVG